ncbi:MAG: hypothetical protein A2044_05300 [Candidatus Firestonebacteria bacterium GWA2_43_8]|nr:MAG: hypothetical protein A2044_05300 [Candidatus Firestonebacteria bacterium GWA2_43_8]
MKEREDLLKSKELCERILSRDPSNKTMLEKLETVKKRIRLIERRLTDAAEEKKHDKILKPSNKHSVKTEYL